MTPDQVKRLQALSERVAEVVILDADPENWTGFGIAPKDMDEKTRGNAKWDRALAAQSLSVLIRVTQIAGLPTGEAEVDDRDDMSPKQAEAAAVALLDRVQKSRRGL